MDALWDNIVKRLPLHTQEILNKLLKQCKDVNPNNCYQQSAIQTLKQAVHASESTEVCIQLATMVFVFTQKMQANEELISLLSNIDHPFVKIFIEYYNETPSKYEETLEKIQNLIKELEQSNSYSLEQKALVLSVESWVVGQHGDISALKRIHNEINKMLPKQNEPIIQFGLQEAFLNIIWWYLHFGVDINIRELLKNIEPYVLKYKFYKNFTTFLNVRGAVESFLGNNTSAKESFERLAEIHSEYNDTYRLSIATGNLAEVYLAMGQIHKAKDLMEQAIKMYQESTGKWPYLYLVELGNIYYALGDDRAEQYFLQAFEIQKENVSIHKAYILYEVVHYYLRTENLSVANRYLSELKDLAKNLELPAINARLDYLQGFYDVLKYNLANGVSYLQNALNKAHFTKDMELLQFCNIQLATAYLLYYKFNPKIEYLNNAINYIETVQQLSKENSHYQAFITSTIIRAIVETLLGNVDEAEQQLETLTNTAQVDLVFFMEDIQKIKTAIQAARTADELKLSLGSALEYLLPQFRNLLSFKIEQKKIKNAKILGILIISEAGIPVYSKIASELKTDDLLLSGLIMAISQLANDIVEGQGRLKEVNYGNFSITLQAIKNGMIAVIASEITASVRIWALTIAEKLKEIPAVVVSYSEAVLKKVGDIIEQMHID